MKWYKRDPAAALEGMLGLSGEERGYYNTLLDLLYARAPNGDVTDELVVKAMGERPQVWRRVKAALIAKGKVRETAGKLTANRVETEVKLAGYRRGLTTSLEDRNKKKQQVNDDKTISTTISRKYPPSGDSARARATRLPEDWDLSAEDLTFANTLNLRLVEIESERDKFRDYWRAKAGKDAAKLDWSATWRNWIRRAAERPNGHGKSHRKSLGEIAHELADECREREREIGISRPFEHVRSG